MGRYLVKVDEDRYLLWSSIVDAPLGWIMSKAELNAHYEFAPTRNDIDRWVERAVPLSEVGWNRAGPNEECLTPEQIIARYTAPNATPSGGEEHGK